MPIPSPCINVCVLHPENGLCLGCYRSMDEIVRWAAMADQECLQIMEELYKRHHLLALPACHVNSFNEKQ